MADKDWVPEFEGQWPPLNGSRPVHGLYSPATFEPLADVIEEHLRVQSPEYAAADDFARRTLANQIARQELGRRFLNEHGLIDKDGRVWPIVEQLAKLERVSLEYMRDLGMTTTSRAELELDRLQIEKDTVSFAELQNAIAIAFEVALKYVPRERVQEYLSDARSALGAVDAGSAVGIRAELEG